MKDGIRNIVGKTISSVVVGKNSHRDPQIQVILVFEDGTSFEFWGSQFSCAGGIDKGGITEAATYIQNMGGKITDIYPGENE